MTIYMEWLQQSIAQAKIYAIYHLVSTILMMIHIWKKRCWIMKWVVSDKNWYFWWWTMYKCLLQRKASKFFILSKILTINKIFISISTNVNSWIFSVFSGKKIKYFFLFPLKINNEIYAVRITLCLVNRLLPT